MLLLRRYRQDELSDLRRYKEVPKLFGQGYAQYPEGRQLDSLSSVN